ncbi:hypothetical protein TL16_g09420 [Triparma laevis f. inornata]|uniref:Uncharacterized protein n=1 Tax=Triparma laevis f. inornata TaxID=1714386 RepID=A0A9W7B2X5_9STRA|nr:hypothetical protein TL16_g09420 [Triparma laevis f. inornata]
MSLLPDLTQILQTYSHHLQSLLLPPSSPPPYLDPSSLNVLSSIISNLSSSSSSSSSSPDASDASDASDALITATKNAITPLSSLNLTNLIASQFHPPTSHQSILILQFLSFCISSPSPSSLTPSLEVSSPNLPSHFLETSLKTTDEGIKRWACFCLRYMNSILLHEALGITKDAPTLNLDAFYICLLLPTSEGYEIPILRSILRCPIENLHAFDVLGLTLKCGDSAKPAMKVRREANDDSEERSDELMEAQR